jgi:hypothetical protein
VSRGLLVGVTVAVEVGLGSGGSAQPATGPGPAWSLPARPVTLTYWDSAESVKNELVRRLPVGRGREEGRLGLRPPREHAAG